MSEKTKEIENLEEENLQEKPKEEMGTNEFKENIKEEKKDEKQNKSKEIGILKIQLEESTDRLKRVMAEFENYKKRNEKEKDNLYSSILSDIIIMFLPIIDNLEKAVNIETKDESYKQGVELLLKQTLEVLRNLGVEPIESTGKSFDPELHEAVSSIEDNSLGEKIIKEEYRKGYKIGTKVIRHSMVVVAN
jgi:molecular chaperone GrpE